MEKEIGGSLFLFEVLGLQCFSLKHLKPENVDKRPNILRTIYMFLLFCSLCAFTVGYVSHDRALTLQKKEPKYFLVFIIKNSMSVGLILVVFTSFVESYRSTKNIKKIFLNAKEITKACFNKFNVVVDFKKSKKGSWKRVLKGIIFLVILQFFVIISNVLFSRDGSFVVLFQLFPSTYLLMIVFKYVFYVGMVNNQLEELKELLVNTFKQQESEIIENGKSITVLSTMDPLCKLRACWRIYNIIYENGLLINESQGLTVLMCLGSLIVALSISGYQLFVIIVGGMLSSQIPGNNNQLDFVNFN